MPRKAHIAIIVPPFTAVPPKGQGGTERIAHEMIQGFCKRGYKVTLFGAGRYKGSAKFVQVFTKTIAEQRIDTTYIESSRPLRLETAYLASVMQELLKRERQFDIVFNHARSGYLFLPLTHFLKTPVVNILHLPLFEEMAKVLAFYKRSNVVTISNSQRKGFSQVKYLATIYNGVHLSEFQFQQKPKDYFLFVGALGEHKNPKEAIQAAKKAGVKLILVGGKKREPYFSKEVKPLIDGKQIQYKGEVAGKQRINLFRSAKALLFPIKWEEPFGLVMIEAMACGTPVIAYRHGAVKEIVKHGKTGFIVRNVTEMAGAIKKINLINRKVCRAHVEQHFSTEKMLDGYEKIIKSVVKK
tara:strand:+ start:2975 stop:4039 length:1065 start_codon:yes stop_codon:yes gene_type:complete